MEFGQAYAAVLPPSHRHVLQDAAKDLIDTTLQDLSASDSPGWSADNWLIGTMLPARYRLRYTGDFVRKFFVCLVTVVWKLGQREMMRPSCVAEELAAHVLIHEAEALLEVNCSEYLSIKRSAGGSPSPSALLGTRSSRWTGLPRISTHPVQRCHRPPGLMNCVVR